MSDSNNKGKTIIDHDNTQRFDAVVDVDVVKRFREIAASQGRSARVHAGIILKEYVDNYDSKA